ncbi:MAG: sugar transferase, partial [Deltaproteobacteria bacterium]|nr:sugar transferase [Deltaproteobacteria bacterium]
MLREFISKIKNGSQNNGAAAVLNQYVLSQEDFLDRLRQERLRSERSGMPVSLLIIKLEDFLDAVLSINGVSAPAILKIFGETLRSTTRETDVKGWYPGGDIAIIATDTDTAGAHVLAAKLADKVESHLSLTGKDYTDELSPHITVCSLLNGGNNYLDSRPSDKGNGRANEQAPFGGHVREPELPQASVQAFCRVDRSGVSSAAVLQWPFAAEVMSREQLRGVQRILKRLIDIVGSLVGLVLFAPLMLLIAAAIKLTSRGPVLFKQERLGLLGKPFIFLKFRSMKMNCDSTIHQEYVTKLIRGETEEINQ